MVQPRFSLRVMPRQVSTRPLPCPSKTHSSRGPSHAIGFSSRRDRIRALAVRPKASTMFSAKFAETNTAITRSWQRVYDCNVRRVRVRRASMEKVICRLPSPAEASVFNTRPPGRWNAWVEWLNLNLAELTSHSSTLSRGPHACDFTSDSPLPTEGAETASREELFPNKTRRQGAKVSTMNF